MDLCLSALWIFVGLQNLQPLSIQQTSVEKIFSLCEAIAEKETKKNNKTNWSIAQGLLL